MKMKEYQAIHTRNRTHLKKTITQLNLALNAAIRRKEEEAAYIHIRCLAILWVAFFEVSLNCILHSANKLTLEDRKEILNGTNLLDRWNRLVDTCFKKYYLTKRKRSLTKLNIGSTNYHRYTELKSILSDHIAPVIEIRNRLAHGQWHIALTCDGTSKSQGTTSQIWSLNKKDVMYIKSLIKNTLTLLNDLTCSKDRFEERYDELILQIDGARDKADERFRETMTQLEERQKYKESLGYY